MATPFNNNRISIITKANLRYEGILYNINAEDQKITLTQVKSFGTEGRRPGNEIAPSPEIHEYIIFKGTDIADLKVLEIPNAEPTYQSGIQQPEDASQNTQVQQNQSIQSNTSTVDKSQEQTSQDQKIQKESEKASGNNTISISQNQPNDTQSIEEFDFAKMNEKFQKNTIHDQSNIKSGYKKVDFFDSLSSSTLEKARETIEERNHQKEINRETFGQAYVDQGRQANNYYRKNNYRNYGGNSGQGGYKGGHKNYNNNYGGNNQNAGYKRHSGNYSSSGTGYYKGKKNTNPGTHNQKRYDQDDGELYQTSNDRYQTSNDRYQKGGDKYYPKNDRYQGGGYSGGGKKPQYNDKNKNDYNYQF